MRPDMAKVVTERPRTPSGRFRQFRRPLKLVFDEGEVVDEGQRCEGIRRPAKMSRKWLEKTFSDHLKPLFRFLQGQVGRPWDKVMSEIALVVPKDSTTQIHIWDHIHRRVSVGCYKEGREVLLPDGTPLGWGLYVLAKDGILRDAKRRPSKSGTPPPKDFVVLPGKKGIAVLWEGLWYIVEKWEVLPRWPTWDSFDPLITQDVFQKAAMWRYTPHGNHRVVALAKRSASRHEKKIYGLG